MDHPELSAVATIKVLEDMLAEQECHRKTKSRRCHHNHIIRAHTTTFHRKFDLMRVEVRSGRIIFSLYLGMAAHIKIIHLNTWINTSTADTITACLRRVDMLVMATTSLTETMQLLSAMHRKLITIIRRAADIRIISKKIIQNKLI